MSVYAETVLFAGDNIARSGDVISFTLSEVGKLNHYTGLIESISKTEVCIDCSTEHKSRVVRLNPAFLQSLKILNKGNNQGDTELGQDE